MALLGLNVRPRCAILGAISSQKKSCASPCHLGLRVPLIYDLVYSYRGMFKEGGLICGF